MPQTMTLQKANRRKLYLKLALLVLLGVSGIFAVLFTPLGELFEKQRMIAFFGELSGEWWAPLLLIGLYSVVAPAGLPASPLLVSGGMVFGFWYGSLYNVLGLVLGAMVSFWVGRALGRDAVVQLAGARLRKVEALFERRGFWPLVQIRFLPVPFSVVSYAAALAGVSNFQYFITTVIGLTPVTVLHSYFAPKLIYAAMDGEKPIGLLSAYLGIILLLNLVTGWPTVQSALRRRKRFRELTALREARAQRQA